MKRRTLLAAAGLGVTSTTAGCLQRLDVQPGQTSGDQPVRQSVSNTDDLTPVPAGETLERDPVDGTLGDGGRRHTHTVFVTNSTETDRAVALSIEQDGATVLDESFDIESDGAVKVRISKLAAYTVEATIEATGETETTSVERDQFGCNATSVTMELQDGGQLDASTVSTAMACGNVPTDRVESGDRIEHTVGTIDESDEMQGRHTVRVSNPTDRTWTVRVLLDDEAITRFDGLYTVEPDATAEVIFDRAGSETIDACVLDTGVSVTVDVAEVDRGCNAAVTTVELADTGTLETSTISTSLACHPTDA